MANTYFQFKQFIIHQDRCSMKVGTDGVLLGAWTGLTGVRSILDIGTGTGLIALMLAQRAPESNVVGIEIEQNAFQQAKENFENSTFKNQLSIIHADFNEAIFNSSFDLIVSNPPFFDNGTFSNIDNRAMARHQVNLSIENVIKKSAVLLNAHGNLALILPSNFQNDVVETALKNGLHPARVCTVLPNETKKSKRILVELSKKETSLKQEKLILEKTRHQYSDDARILFKDFYLSL